MNICWMHTRIRCWKCSVWLSYLRDLIAILEKIKDNGVYEKHPAPHSHRTETEYNKKTAHTHSHTLGVFLLYIHEFSMKLAHVATFKMPYANEFQISKS